MDDFPACDSGSARSLSGSLGCLSSHFSINPSFKNKQLTQTCLFSKIHIIYIRFSFVNNALYVKVLLSRRLVHEYSHALMRGYLRSNVYRSIALTLPVAEPKMAKPIVPKALLLPVHCKICSVAMRCLMYHVSTFTLLSSATVLSKPPVC